MNRSARPGTAAHISNIEDFSKIDGSRLDLDIDNGSCEDYHIVKSN